MGIFIELYEAKYKGGKRRRGRFKDTNIGLKLKWIKSVHSSTRTEYYVEGFSQADVQRGTADVSVVVEVLGDTIVNVVGLIVTSKGIELYEGMYHSVQVALVGSNLLREKKKVEAKMGKLGLVKNGKVVSYWYKA